MKKSKKILLLALALVLVAAVSIAGTLAYLTSKTEAVNNTFTIGNVTITLDEHEVEDAYGETLTNTVTQSNEYKLLPGHTYQKDPTVHVIEESEACWVFVKVEDGLAAIEDDTTVADQILANGWTALADVDNVFYQQVAADDAATGTDLVVFETFKIKADVANEALADYAGATIVITAYAIQADGLETAAAAWEAGGFGGSSAAGGDTTEGGN